MNPRCFVCADYTVPHTAPSHDWQQCPRLANDPYSWQDTAPPCTYPAARSRYGIRKCYGVLDSSGKCDLSDRHVPTVDHDPVCDDPNPRWLRADHDPRCLIWASDDPTTCDCDDGQGYSPDDHEAAQLAAALARYPVTVFACDTDTYQAGAS